MWSHASFVGSFFTVEENSTSSVFILALHVSTFSVIIINKVIITLISYRLRDVWTGCATNAWSDAVEVVDATVVVVGGVVGSVEHVEAPHSLWYTWCIIKVPVSGSVSNGHTLEIIKCANWSSDVASVGDVVLEVGLVELPGEIWKIDASVAFSRKIKVISLEFWICSEEHLNTFEKIFGLSHIILSPVCFSAGS